MQGPIWESLFTWPSFESSALRQTSQPACTRCTALSWTGGPQCRRLLWPPGRCQCGRISSSNGPEKMTDCKHMPLTVTMDFQVCTLEPLKLVNFLPCQGSGGKLFQPLSWTRSNSRQTLRTENGGENATAILDGVSWNTGERSSSWRLQSKGQKSCQKTKPGKKGQKRPCQKYQNHGNLYYVVEMNLLRGPNSWRPSLFPFFLCQWSKLWSMISQDWLDQMTSNFFWLDLRWPSNKFNVAIIAIWLLIQKLKAPGKEAGCMVLHALWSVGLNSWRPGRLIQFHYVI